MPAFYESFPHLQALIEYAAAKNIPVLSTEENNLAHCPPELKASSKPEQFSIIFEKGIPVKLVTGSNTITDSVELFFELNAIICRQGVRLEVNKSPALVSLRMFHTDLESLVLDRKIHALRDEFVAPNYSRILYNGRNLSAEREWLENSIIESRKNVNDIVRCYVHKGSFTMLDRSRYTSKVYDKDMEWMGE